MQKFSSVPVFNEEDMEINNHRKTRKCDVEVFASDKFRAVKIINICQQLKQKKPTTTVQQTVYKFS